MAENGRKSQKITANYRKLQKITRKILNPRGQQRTIRCCTQFQFCMLLSRSKASPRYQLLCQHKLFVCSICIHLDLYTFIILNCLAKGIPEIPIAQHTIFGQTLAGPISMGTHVTMPNSLSSHISVILRSSVFVPSRY